MNKIEEAIIYATKMHQGKVRKFTNTPYILHPLEVAQILSTMTKDEDVITAGILHDIVEDTEGTLQDLENLFGKRVAELVDSESENKYPGEDKRATWKRRKEESILVLKNSTDIGVKQLWLADKLANIRSLAGIYSEQGEAMWQVLNQSDPAMHCWYYKSIGETVELSLNKTGAFKEFIKHINFIWPGTFDSNKAMYRKYKEVSVEGCKQIGHGAKGDVYRYNDELVIKVYNENNTYGDVEKEIAHSRKAFILGLPTAISFGIVSVGDRYGAMYELLDSETVSGFIARNPKRVGDYAVVMANLGKAIHSIKVSSEDDFPKALERLRYYVQGGIELEDADLSEKCMRFIDTIPDSNILIHGDFHTGNVFLQNGEPLLIDMDRLSTGDPIIELSDIYYFYVVLGEDDPSIVENFMGFSYETAREFFDLFLKSYLGTDDEKELSDVVKKASLIGAIRLINKLHRKENLTDRDLNIIKRNINRISELTHELL